MRPRFILKSTPENRWILEEVKSFLYLKPHVREYHTGGRHFVILVVTGLADLRSKIVPLGRELVGPKAEKFERWLKQFNYLRGPKKP